MKDTMAEPDTQSIEDTVTGIDFNIFVGAEIGFLKGINLNRKAIITKNFKRDFLIKSEGRQIASLSWNNPSTQEEIIVGFQNQKVLIFDTTCNSYTGRQSYQFGEGPLVSAFKKSGNTIVALQSGEVGIVHGTDSTTLKTLTSTYSDRYTKKQTLCRAIPSLHHPSQFATGGCENDLAIWDINDPSTSVFKAKNVKPDMLQLRVPIWISDLVYLPDSDLIATCSRHKHVRLYDVKAQRRPVVDLEFEDHPLISIAAVPSSERQIVVGSNHGRVVGFDLRMPSPKSPIFALKSFAGAVKSIALHETLPLVFTVSWDRFVRVHHLHKKNVIYKEYLKSRLTSLLVRRDLKEEDFIWTEPPRIMKKRKIIEEDPLKSDLKENEGGLMRRKRKAGNRK